MNYSLVEKDGLSIEESPLYKVDSIYANREWRFYADIVFNGCQYRGRKVEFFVPDGLDSPDGRDDKQSCKVKHC